jgi:hypothetical protein
MRFDLVKAASFPFPTQMVCFVMSVVLSRLIPPRYFANAVPASQPKETGLEQHNITCQRGSARQCCKGHASFLWEKPKFDPSQKPNPIRYKPQKFTRLITLVTYTDVPTAIAIG